MTAKPPGAPEVRPPTTEDFAVSFRKGLADFRAAPLLGLFFSGFYVVTGLLMAWITYLSGNTFWLVLAVLGFPLVGAFAAIGFYETSRRREAGEPLVLDEIAGVVWSERSGQLPWIAVIIVVFLLFWFFLGHMIFALFLSRLPMTNVFTNLDLILSPSGIMMLGFGSAVGAVFAALIFAGTVLGIPMILDRDVDFVSAILRSFRAVRESPLPYLAWGALIATVTLLAMVPFFLGLFLVLPIFGHATWHLYRAVTG